MASAIVVTPMDEILPIPSYSSSQKHTLHNFPFHKHDVHIPFSVRSPVHVDAGLIHDPCTRHAVNRQTKWKSPYNNVNSLSRESLLDSNTSTNASAYASLLQACTDIQQLHQLHGHIFTNGLDQNIKLLTRLVRMYTLHGSMDSARLIFNRIYKTNVLLWNVMIRGYARNGPCEEALTLYCLMQRAGIQPDNFTYTFLLKACASLSALREGEEIHCHVAKNEFESDVFVGNSLVALYAKCRRIEFARQLFDKMPKRDVVTWNTMIAGYVQNGYATEALTLFNQMRESGMKFNLVTVVSVLPACAHLAALQQGKLIHAFIIQRGFESDVVIGTALIDMYAKCGCLKIARHLFDQLFRKNVVSWSAMITGYAQNGHANEALKLFNQMQGEDVKPDSVTIVSVLLACGQLAALQQGKCIYGYILRKGFESDVVVGTALMDTYAKCGSIEIARRLFDKMPKRNVVSWNAMIAGYAQNGQANEALTLFNQMQLAGIKLDLGTMLSVLPACAHLAALQQGKWIHGYIIRSEFQSEVVWTALIDMYAKCGAIENAWRLFIKMSTRDVVSWNAMIAGYGMHGYGQDALALFSQMLQTDIKPNDISFICILSACSHAGMVEEGRQCFDCMIQDYFITPSVEHYACMVDLLGRAGHLEEAHNLIKSMPLEPGASVWGALLGACRICCNIELGECVAERLLELEPEKAGRYVLLSNIYAAAGRWEDVGKVRTMMKERGVQKTPGCSLIEVHNRVHSFRVGDRSHPQSEKIYAMLETLTGQIKEAGYVPNTNFVLHDVEEELKENMLSSHSEKLAIAFGLINTSPGTPIQITKNLRVCGDCHSATKFISKIVRREIIVRDANRYHHLKDGVCSCGDYW
eukprot:Gb_02229 [translate_table: standard]